MSDPTAPVEPHDPTFESIFFPGGSPVPLCVPDFQRAFSWEEKQTALFIGDLAKYHALPGKYYFGHFIVEQDEDTADQWEIVDGQQRITTFILFLMICRELAPEGDHAFAYQLIERFSTVSYDRAALKAIGERLRAFLTDHATSTWNEKEIAALTDGEITDAFLLTDTGDFTRSQHRIVLTLLRFHHAFMSEKGPLRPEHIAAYIGVIMQAKCSHHLATDKAVAVNIFEMHNTRGIPLSTIEIIKAKLMKFVHDHGGENHKVHVAAIQTEFGHIFGMEESLAAHSFRGDMTMEQLLRHHLRVIDDGHKRSAQQFKSPAMSDSAADLIAYVEKRLQEELATAHQAAATDDAVPAAVRYALDFATEFRRSMQIMSRTLHAWDLVESLVGDVLILERGLSCEFFLIVCRRLPTATDGTDGRLSKSTLLLWEKLLFTRDFHEKYYYLQERDKFQELFETIDGDEAKLQGSLQRYLTDGFRPGHTTGLQSIVSSYLHQYRDKVLKGAYYWWKQKMIYVIYKYETHSNVDLRRVMKGSPSVEHLVPQQWEWIKDHDDTLKALSENETEWENFRKEVDECIDGIGNLLLITGRENTRAGNNAPADKYYEKYITGGTYKEHDQDREKWRRCRDWPELIEDRGDKIFTFMITHLIAAPATPPASADQ